MVGFTEHFWPERRAGARVSALELSRNLNPTPFVLSKLFARGLKGGIERQGLRLAMRNRVASMKRSAIEVGRRHLGISPEYATLLPGYPKSGN